MTILGTPAQDAFFWMAVGAGLATIAAGIWTLIGQTWTAWRHRGERTDDVITEALNRGGYPGGPTPEGKPPIPRIFTPGDTS